MKLKTFTVVILILSLFYIGSTAYYFNNQVAQHDMMKDNIYSTLSDLDFLLSNNNCHNLMQSSVLLKRKLITNKYLNNISLYDKNKPIIYTSRTFIDKPASIPLTFDKGNIENFQHLKTIITCYPNGDKKEYDLIISLDSKKIKSLFNENLVKYFLVFVLYPTFIFTIIGYLISKFIFNPLHQLKQYTTEQGVIIPPYVKITELEELRISTVDAFEQLKEERKESYKLSRTDLLTGIGNNHYLNEQIQLLIDDTDISTQNFSVLSIDVDDFKSINNSLGLHAGDTVLIEIVRILKDILHYEDIITRVGVDVFVIIITSVNTEEKLERLINSISTNIHNDIIIDGTQLHTTVNIGIVKYPDDGVLLNDLLQRSNIALFKSKDLGKNKHVYFNNSMLKETLYLIELSKNMETALINNDYGLYYQPQVDIKMNKIVGAEALIRWNNNGVQISPVEFIPVAEKTGFIIDLGWWIITTALKEKLAWEKQGIDLTMSINIAAKQFADIDFYDNFKFYMQKFKVNPTQIVLEITEYIFLYEETSLLNTFNNLRELGVSISLDDFGTGYSSLSYIKNFPIDTIKIDKSFIDDYASEDGMVFLETIISMAINLEIDLVAEGVEEQEQLNFLSKRHCSKYQGYLCSKPLPAKEFLALYTESIK